MRKCLLKFIIKSYALDRKRFIMPSKNGAISLRTEDVFDIFGLQNKGKDAMKARGKGGLKAKVKVPSRFLDSNTGEMMIDELIENIVASGTYDDDFLRRIVLVLLGTVLAPQSTKEVPNAYYKLVHDVEAIKAFNWNAFTLCVCVEGFTKTLSDLTKFTWPIGNLALLQYLFWEKVQPLDDEAFDPLAHEYPLMLNWSEDEAKKRDAYDTSYGRGNGTIVVEKLEKKGLVFKPNKGSDDDIEFVEHSEDWVGKYGPSKYKSSKYWTDVKSTPAKEDMDNRVDASFTTGNGNKLAREKGVHHNTPGTGDEGDPFVIEDNGNSPNPSLATVDTNDFPAITSTPKNMNEVSDGSSADKSEEISMDSLNTRIKNAKENGTPENDGKENDGKHKRKQSKYCLSPYQQNGGRKRAKKSLFGIRAAMINTDYINEDHIEAAKVYIRTLADSEKLCSKTVVHMTGIGGETCTPEMLEAIISKKWLHGGVINSYCNHMQTHNPRADRHILSSWVSHWLILRADGKVNNSKRHFMDHFTNQTKMVSRVTEEYFIKDKAYFPFHVEENHWITVLMHNKKKEFQVLNSTGKCSKRVLAKIAKLRAEIANDTKEVNALIETEHPDVSSWPIREYDMPSQTDGVSCGLFVVKCVQNWDGDDWTFEFDQDEVNASRGRILAEILFSECNTKEVVKEKILKIMEKK
ncbi:hypothetical protein CFC21_108408 [Triticum aestivum]|uniref:Ubiquitin-like protease family profile domain-containing protein n=1 Tax=Triticum aestivum TaxID=4565 RepID=A0A9R1NBQ2_WHEAT|nr:hypothetical protein CFC21_108408 [Triticum aestivum]